MPGRRPPLGSRGLALAAASLITATSGGAAAWAEHEHIRIGRRALAELTYEQPQIAAALEAAWQTLRRDPALGPSLCADARGYGPRCIGLPALPMLAGDHACTTDDLLAAIPQEWTVEVLGVALAAGRKVEDLDFEETDPRDVARGRQHVRREIDVELQTVDPGHISRATDNTAHYLLTRRSDVESLAEIIARSTGCAPDQAANATALYLHFHGRALHEALQAGEARGEARVAWTRRALLDEVFALHFLEDAFSSGHLVGTPEDDPTRNGTHDHYCRHGLVTRLWGGGPTYAAHGDAFLFAADLERASRAVQASLVQLVNALDPAVEVRPSRHHHALLDVAPAQLTAEERALIRASPPRQARVDTCTTVDSRPELVSPSLHPLMERVLLHTPQPAITMAPSDDTGGLATTLPTFRNEFGPFIPVTLRVYGGTERLFDPAPGFGASSFVTSLRGGIGFGYATDGVLSEYQDGLTYATVLGSLGLRGTDQLRGANWDNVAELGIGGRLRVPYAYVPGDFFVWGPMAWAGSAGGLRAMSKALKGGFTPWGESNTLVAGDVRLTLELGREVELLALWSRAAICVAGTSCTPDAALTSTGWELSTPIFAARVSRTFEGRLGHELWARVGLRFGHQSERLQDALAPNPDASPAAQAPAGATYGIFLALDSMARFYP